jgi:diacylglycerol kinase family enzyme
LTSRLVRCSRPAHFPNGKIEQPSADWRNLQHPGAISVQYKPVPDLKRLSADARTVLIGVNPHAGAQNRQAIVQAFCDELAALDLQPQIFRDADRLADEAARLLAAGRLRAVVAAGGDGTIRLLAERTTPETPLFILPLGTENLLARYLELTPDPRQSARIVANGLTVRHDAGLAGDRIFTLMAGCGFDADVVRRLHDRRQGHIHHLSYAKPILDAIRKYDYPELRVYYAPADAADANADLTQEISARWAFVVNLPRYAGGLSFAPGASGSDGLLDVCTFKEGSLWYGLVYLSGVLLGQHETMQDFERVQTRRLRIESAGLAPFQLDGDPGGQLPVEIRVLPARLTLLVTTPWAVRQGFIPTDADAT